MKSPGWADMSGPRMREVVVVVVVNSSRTTTESSRKRERVGTRRSVTQLVCSSQCNQVKFIIKLYTQGPFAR